MMKFASHELSKTSQNRLPAVTFLYETASPEFSRCFISHSRKFGKDRRVFLGIKWCPRQDLNLYSVTY